MSDKLNLAIGHSARTKIWKNRTMHWAEFADRIKDVSRINLGLADYLKASKDEQSNLKDVGGYVGGYLRGGKRNPESVAHRQLLTLDIDFASIDFWDDFTMLYGNAAILHGTAKHSIESPRYRLLMPLSRECDPVEYEAVARKVAGTLGIDLFDSTTFQTCRLMFWPSCPNDVNYYYREQAGDWLDVDATLAEYIDYTDSSLWAVAGGKIREIGEAAKKQADPTAKKGIVGAFCRSYSVPEAIDTFLSEEYIPTDKDDRYTYTKGSTAAGLMIYDDLLAYSHHGSDPISGQLCNAFDLVRVHKFGHLDIGNSQGGVNAKSFKAMEELARQDTAVKKTLADEALENARYDFEEDLDELDADLDEGLDEEALEALHKWRLELEVDGKGKNLCTSSNISLILANDLRLKATFMYNAFDRRRYVLRSMPWRKVKSAEPIRNVDYAGLRHYIESFYGITGVSKIEDALALEFEKNTQHPIQGYLNGLTWDGAPRVDALLVDYFGAPDNLYTREAIRKTLTAAVARVFEPGRKFDVVLTLVGPQGSNKSSFIKMLGKEWYSDTFNTVQGKEALEQIQGSWIIELGELAALRKAEVETVKHFISKQEDTFRAAYAQSAETYRRQCVFIATTNKREFLTDATGNRRFAPIDVRPELATKNVWSDLTPEAVNLIWAEAVQLYKDREPLYFSAEASALASKEQAQHCETDERLGLIEKFLNSVVPSDWDSKDLYERQQYLDLHTGEDEDLSGDVREIVCTAELWCECLGKKKEDMTRYNTRDINDLMKGLKGWEYCSTTKSFSIYGKQRYFKRKNL